MKALGKLFSLLILIICIGAGTCVWSWNSLNTSVKHSYSDQPLEIGRGESLDQIFKELEQRGILSQALPLRLYLKINKLNPIVKAGNYFFPSPITPIEVLKRLERGGEYNKLTVVEGWTQWDIAQAMTKINSLKLPNSAAALLLLNNSNLIQDLDPSAANLEGYLFPDTYFIVANSTADELVKEMVQRFREVWRTKLKDSARANNISVHDLVTIASIIETEAKLKEERPLVASVIANRLKKHMPLSMDSTIVYASKLSGAWKNDGKVYQSDVDRISPYNTRKIVGLPPGPVGCPGLSSLEAAAAPAQSNYLYYVRNPDRNDGAHNFYADEKSFNVGVAALRNWEAKQKKS